MTVPLNTAKGPRDLLGHKSTPPSHLVCKRDGWFLFIFRKFKSSLHHPYIGFSRLYQKGRYNGNRNMKFRGKVYLLTIMCYVFIDVQHSMSALTLTTSKIEGAKYTVQGQGLARLALGLARPNPKRARVGPVFRWAGTALIGSRVKPPDLARPVPTRPCLRSGYDLVQIYIYFYNI